jgi:hypothetical protein
MQPMFIVLSIIAPGSDGKPPPFIQDILIGVNTPDQIAEKLKIIEQFFSLTRGELSYTFTIKK